MERERTCPYCQHTFETAAQRDAHVPCPDQRGDRELPVQGAELAREPLPRKEG
jgi:hypothetical protein